MRLATVRLGDPLSSTRAARLERDSLVLLPAASVSELLARSDWRAVAAEDGDRVAPDESTFAPVVPRPPKIVCLGLNYLRHIREMNSEPPAFPTLFAKYAGALIGARDEIQMPAVARQMDWEVELGVVIGRPARLVSPADALDYVAGYTVVNDVTARDWQSRTTQFLQGKTFEHTTPVGPYLVTPDELPRGGRDLEVRCEVDGQLMQRDNTTDLIFDVAHTIAYISQILTLEPGDLISMGTPDGVGAGRDPEVWLQPGNSVRTVVEGVGGLLNVCSGWT